MNALENVYWLTLPHIKITHLSSFTIMDSLSGFENRNIAFSFWNQFNIIEWELCIPLRLYLSHLSRHSHYVQIIKCFKGFSECVLCIYQFANRHFLLMVGHLCWRLSQIKMTYCSSFSRLHNIMAVIYRKKLQQVYGDIMKRGSFSVLLSPRCVCFAEKNI